MAQRQNHYNPKRHEAIVEAMRKGTYRSTAAKLVGIHPSTLSTWLREGEDDPESRYRRLWEEVSQAEAEWEAEQLQIINEAAASRKPGTWTAAAWNLERHYPDRYGRNDRVTVEGGEQPIQVATHHLLANPEAMEALLGKLAAMQKPAPVGELDAGEIEGELVAEHDGFLRP